MRNKFKRGENVVVNGFGKIENRYYINEFGSIIEKDDFFLDYNVLFQGMKNDWFEEKSLKKVRKCMERK